MFKKISGLFIIALAGVFSLAAFRAIYKILFVPTQKTGNEAYDTGSTIGHWFFLLLLLVAIFFMFKFGFKLVKKKQIAADSIDQIGS